MAVVKGVKEKVHLPVFDSVSVKPGKRLGDILTSNVMRFFQDVTGKTKIQTNMQAASLLPNWNTYEARALRVVISDFPAQFPDTPTVDHVFDLTALTNPPQGKVTFNLRHFVDLKRRIEGPNGQAITFSRISGEPNGNEKLRELDLTITVTGRGSADEDELTDELIRDESFTIDRAVLKALEVKFRQAVPTNEQISSHDGFGTVIGKFIYNTVTTFFVGEKIMIQVPTYFFPAGAGPYSEDGRGTTHGYPNPQATFRFAEPVMIDAQQNFRVEIEVPESEVLSELQRLYGPLIIWTVIDGYMTRDVQ